MSTIALKMRDRVLVPQCWVARSFFSRFMGLMGRSGLSANEAMLFPKCNSIHTFFMRFPIDVVLVDAQGAVVGVEENVRPWRLLLPKRRTRHVIELRAMRSRELGIAPGVVLERNGVWG